MSLLFSYIDKTPKKVKLSAGNPQALKATDIALAPGNTSIETFLSMHLFTNLYPLSDIPGVPLSHISPIFKPIFIIAINLSTFFSSLKLEQPIINPLPFLFLAKETLFLKYTIKGTLKPYTSKSVGLISSSSYNSLDLLDPFSFDSLISSNFFYL